MLLILLPAYNEERSLDPMMEDIQKTFKKIKEDYRIVICNDGSKDATGELASAWSEKLPILMIDHKINRGLGETERDLFEKAAELAKDDDIAIRLDCDDTHPIDIIPEMIRKIREEEKDVIIASRFAEGGGQKGVSEYRAFISNGATLFMRLFFPAKGVREYTSGYRAYKGSILKKAIKVYGNSFLQLKGLGFATTLETLVKLNLIGARFDEVGMMLRYDKKKSESKMVSSITMLGYIVLVIITYWPSGGWFWKIKRVMKERLGE